ncbi:putative ethanolamine-phosphate cytidylyltransferase [Astathelohania contejeani]|uniref:ethanolamine-phosphate cytidylyltransferase n=1 Tax=Astathelohania contejeani TaxID=164912 RepID=A0ABQ7HVN4_9MICR|nr:putative ethanolamine-phosphate cytidylyltransferase [Thelohania contejeani]
MKKIWIDGCFDMFHYGHANAIRQAKADNNYVIVGVHSSEDILFNKGLPVLSCKERGEVVRACRWTGEVVEGSPYATCREVYIKYGCELVMHGNDASINTSGDDTYMEPKINNEFSEFERTEGISTTEIVGRMLLRQKAMTSPLISNELTDLQKCLLEKFALPIKERKGKVVYVDGSFDLYHAGHCSLLAMAKKQGDYLVAGIHDDIEMGKIKAPVLNFIERKLALLSNKYIDEVVDAPYYPSEEYLNKLGVNIIVCGKGADKSCYKNIGPNIQLIELDHEYNYLSSEVIIKRIIDNYIEYEKRNNIRKERGF